MKIPFSRIFEFSSEEVILFPTATQATSRKRVRAVEELHKVISTASVQTSTNPFQAPYVWADTGIPVTQEGRSRQTKSNF